MAVILNKQVEFTTRANSMYTSINPKPGMLIFGDGGVEFRANAGNGFIQIPWREVTGVRAQAFFWNKYIRGFFIDTKSGSFNFVVSRARQALTVMDQHLSRDVMSINEGLVQRRLKKNK
ncbi:DUF956 family protein [Periweissella cryptocerci]|uniref:DUF956 family protein n=1 Tax=Periweissella cryptocerci TaxID=2506420 RepID=A0A4P6YVX0_9LACO|nr:DUF956 family protein [Periweissella cryptocerci]QBO36877.1 DUF956 family protein [Periweissella cryptocerci]